MDTTTSEDWRSGAYGANRRAHLFVWKFSSRKGPACGIRATDKYGRRSANIDRCPECLRAVA